MDDPKLIWAVATTRGQTPDRMWHTPDSGPFTIEPGLFSSRWMRRASPGEIQAVMGDEPNPIDPVSPSSMDGMTDEELSAHYTTVMGEKPHHAAKRETLIAKITEKLNAD